MSGYTLQSSVNLDGRLASEGAVQGNFANLGTSGTFTDRPTITYTPITGQQFNKSFMTPIPPGAIFFMIQSGWPADLIYSLTVDSINGLKGRVSGGVNARPGDPMFTRVAQLFRKIQQSLSINANYVEAINNKNELEKKIAEQEAKVKAQQAPKIVLKGAARPSKTKLYGGSSTSTTKEKSSETEIVKRGYQVPEERINKLRKAALGSGHHMSPGPVLTTDSYK